MSARRWFASGFAGVPRGTLLGALKAEVNADAVAMAPPAPPIPLANPDLGASGNLHRRRATVISNRDASHVAELTRIDGRLAVVESELPGAEAAVRMARAELPSWPGLLRPSFARALAFLGDSAVYVTISLALHGESWGSFPDLDDPARADIFLSAVAISAPMSLAAPTMWRRGWLGKLAVVALVGAVAHVRYLDAAPLFPASGLAGQVALHVALGAISCGMPIAAWAIEERFLERREGEGRLRLATATHVALVREWNALLDRAEHLIALRGRDAEVLDEIDRAYLAEVASYETRLHGHALAMVTREWRARQGAMAGLAAYDMGVAARKALAIGAVGAVGGTAVALIGAAAAGVGGVLTLGVGGALVGEGVAAVVVSLVIGVAVVCGLLIGAGVGSIFVLGVTVRAVVRLLETFLPWLGERLAELGDVGKLAVDAIRFVFQRVVGLRDRFAAGFPRLLPSHFAPADHDNTHEPSQKVKAAIHVACVVLAIVGATACTGPRHPVAVRVLVDDSSSEITEACRGSCNATAERDVFDALTKRRVPVGSTFDSDVLTGDIDIVGRYVSHPWPVAPSIDLRQNAWRTNGEAALATSPELSGAGGSALFAGLWAEGRLFSHAEHTEYLVVASDLRDRSPNPDRRGRLLWNFEREVPAPDDVVATLRAHDLIPDLRGVHVVACNVHGGNSTEAATWSASKEAAVETVFRVVVLEGGAADVAVVPRCADVSL
ncbi:MAG: hypothetical protein WC538_21120 [Thermoanaerobaculia bacterium]